MDPEVLEVLRDLIKRAEEKDDPKIVQIFAINLLSQHIGVQLVLFTNQVMWEQERAGEKEMAELSDKLTTFTELFSYVLRVVMRVQQQEAFFYGLGAYEELVRKSSSSRVLINLQSLTLFTEIRDVLQGWFAENPCDPNLDEAIYTLSDVAAFLTVPLYKDLNLKTLTERLAEVNKAQVN